jgi:hypothetical protein
MQKHLPIYLLLTLAFFLRIPFISAGMPYFQNEDEAHHFNRNVEMLKTGDLNPHYFHKPSLHFYLRLPVLAAGFFWTVKNAQIRSIQEVQTRNEFGLAGYNFSASHPSLVKWSRAFSVICCLIAILAIYFCALELGLSSSLSFLAAFLAALSPELLIYSPVIGVDMPMSMFCVLCSYFALRYTKSNKIFDLLSSALLAGCALSTKYNALPIIFVPVISVIFASNAKKSLHLALSILLPIVFFFICSPAILTSIPLFLDQFAYEIWHYGIAGHEGHTEEPGLSQAIFYLKWLGNKAIGWPALLAVLLTLPILIINLISSKKVQTKYWVFISFPAIFFLLMIAQKTNFERNLLVLIPYFSVFVVITLNFFFLYFLERKFARIIIQIFIFALLLKPIKQSVAEYQKLYNQSESRVLAINWLRKNLTDFQDLAVSGELQFADFNVYDPQAQVFKQPRGTHVYKLEDLDALKLYQQGFDFIAVSSEKDLKNLEFFEYKVAKTFAGTTTKQRIIIDPQIEIIQLLQIKLEQINASALPEFSESQKTEQNLTDTWLEQRVYKIGNTNPLDFEFTSPWVGQELKLICDSFNQETILKVDNTWTKFNLTENYFNNCFLIIKDLHSPSDYGLNSDTRRLAVQIRKLKK